MNSTIKAINTAIERGSILSNISTTFPDSDSALDKRDSPEFDGAWVARMEAIQGKKVRDNEEKMIDAIREASFMIVCEGKLGSECAGYVSDDFELICRYACLGIHDGWIAGLLSSYVNDVFPCGLIPEDNREYDIVLAEIKR